MILKISKFEDAFKPLPISSKIAQAIKLLVSAISVYTTFLANN